GVDQRHAPALGQIALPKAAGTDDAGINRSGIFEIGVEVHLFPGVTQSWTQVALFIRPPKSTWPHANHSTKRPPSTMMTEAVMYEASSEASQSTGYAISMGSAQRPMRQPPSASRLMSSCVRPAASARRRWNGVKVSPGQTALARMPCLASSNASVFVIETMPALVTSYCPIPARGLTA